MAHLLGCLALLSGEIVGNTILDVSTEDCLKPDQKLTAGKQHSTVLFVSLFENG